MVMSGEDSGAGEGGCRARKGSRPCHIARSLADQIMRRIERKIGLGRILLALGVALASAGCSTTPVPPQPVQHVVLMWLERPESAPDRAQLVRAARSLQMMPGVVRVETGRNVPSPAAEANRDFDLGVVITFRDRAALQRYEKNPRHADAMQRYLKPLVRRYVVYNLGTR